MFFFLMDISKKLAAERSLSDLMFYVFLLLVLYYLMILNHILALFIAASFDPLMLFTINVSPFLWWQM